MITVKLLCAFVVTSVITALALAYVRLNSFARDAVSNAVQTSLHRPIYVGRVARCNPLLGIRLVNVELPPSASNPTFPTISAAYVDLTVSGFLRSLVFHRPLRVDVSVHRPTLKVSQRIVIGRKGLPIGKWDPGLPLTDSPRNRPSASSPNLAILDRVLRYIQPGTLSINNAHVILQPARFLDYGHGDEPVHVRNTSATVTFPSLIYNTMDPGSIPIKLRGNFRAVVKGTPLEGGAVNLVCTANGDTIFQLKPNDVAANLHVVGHRVRAARVASFLSLPFRADSGRCSGDIDMDFLFKAKTLIPVMRGEATLDSVGLRFHPDPKTPEFHSICGKLRFEGKTMIMDGPVGELGSLPMAVVGNIHLEDGYDLKSYARPVDVNNVLDTFDVEKFVPIEGIARGEARMTGILEEPMISGWAESVGDRAVFDRLPLDSARLTFAWDAIGGLLRFPEICARVYGGGTVSGSGCMYFDMTKDNPFDIKREQHCKRNPKAEYWNKDSDPSKSLPALPIDIMEIDEFAPYRQYDSMTFNFRASDVNGGDLLKYFGGEYGQMAIKSIGRVSGECVLAGHLKDSNCRVFWKSVSPPPNVFLANVGEEPQLTPSVKVSPPLKDNSSRVSNENVGINSHSTPSWSGSHASLLSDNKAPVEAQPDAHGFLPDLSDMIDSKLGGGDFNGLVYLKFGDPPEARRVKVRTIVKEFDARRAGWGSDVYSKTLRHTPLLRTSMDTFFKGVMFQRPILPPNTLKMPRTPRMKLLGVDGALAVRKFSMNNICFENVLSGSFSFGTSDFAMSLKEVRSPVRTEEDHWNLTSGGTHVHSEQFLVNPVDQITIAASLKGEGNIHYHNGDSKIVASLSKDKNNRQVVKVTSRNIAARDLFGRHLSVTGKEVLDGSVDLDIDLDMTSRIGGGSIFVKDPLLGPLRFSSIAGEIVWNDNNVYFRDGKVKHQSSDYEINARYGFQALQSDFEWDMDVGVVQADVQDVSKLVADGGTVVKVLQDSVNYNVEGLMTSQFSPVWLRNLIQSGSEKTPFNRWQVPQNLSASEMVEWYKQHAEERREIERMERRRKRPRRSEKPRQSLQVEGDVSGRITMSYNSKFGESRSVSTSESSLQSLLDQLSRATFSFLLVGEKWHIGDVPLRNISASGLFEEGIFRLGPFIFEGEKGFGAEAEGRVTRAGSVDGSLIIRNAPAALVQKYTSAPVQVSGECSGRLEVEGNLSNPRALGRLVWTGATLNEKQVRDARTDLACVNGRCLLNVGASIGGRRRSPEQSDKERVESLNWGKGVIAELKDLASKASSKQMETPGRKRVNDHTLNTEEGLQIRISAPVRFYLLNYLRRRASTSAWAEIEPVLGSSSPSDDEWIVANVDVKKYGLLLLNSIAPEVGWEGGDSDVKLRVSGSLQNPVVSGKVSVSDGVLSPSVLEEPLQSVRGEMLINENGLVTMKSINGRCAGKWVTVNGDLFLTRDHVHAVESRLQKDVSALERLTTGRMQRRKRQVLNTRVNDGKLVLQKANRGVNLEFGEIPIDFRKFVVCKLSGKVVVNGVVADPSFGGSVTFSEGVLFLGNAGSVTSSKPNRIRGLKTTRLSKRTAKDSLDRTSSAKQVKTEGGVRLNGLKVSLGRDVKMVQSFLLNIQAAGGVILNGMSNNLNLDGSVRLVKGKVNLLASQMRLARGESSYVKFIGRDQWEREGYGGEPEMMMKLVMEDDNLMVSIGECKTSAWVDNIKVTDKEREVDYEGRWDDDLPPRIEEGGGRFAVKRLVLNSLLKLGEIGGKFGSLEWRVFPALLSRNFVNGDYEFRLREDIGGGGSVDVDGLSVSAAKSVGGRVEGKVLLRFGRWGRLRIGADGNLLSTQLEFFPHLGRNLEN